MNQRTPELAPPCTAAVNCCACPLCMVTAVGEIVTPVTGVAGVGGGGGGTTGATFTVALALLVGSARLVAVMVTACGDVIPLGAVYRPELLKVPFKGDNDHCTPVLVVFNTVALNCCVAPAFSCTVAGLIATLTGAGGCG